MKMITSADIRKRGRMLVECAKASQDEIEDWVIRVVLVAALAIFMLIVVLFLAYQTQGGI